MEEIIDILADEQQIYDDASALTEAARSRAVAIRKQTEAAINDVEAVRYSAALEIGAYAELAEAYAKLSEAYGDLLDEHRRSILISDTTTIELYENNVDLTDKVYHDALTGIYNRRYLEDSLKRIAHSLKRSGDVLGVMMIDIDYFKRYNDTYSHSEGDICLKKVADAIDSTLLRPDDIVARYGGEEFTVLLPYTDEKGARYIAERMLKNVRDLKIPHEKNEASDYVTISIGLTVINADFSQDGDAYLKCADKALYQSKANGRNQYTFIEFK
ncbi:MAG: GGDEF domain-containing protein [Oscillospiraceae bacterium]|nr:GGDEF domain-containing protein [Oscillospiraceae bacterium]